MCASVSYSYSYSHQNDDGESEPEPEPEEPLDEYQGAGWCHGGADDGIGNMNTASECWDACESKYSSALVAIDWWQGSCYCQDACECMANVGDDDVTLLVKKDFELPEECANEPEEPPYEAGCPFNNDSPIAAALREKLNLDLGDKYCGGGGGDSALKAECQFYRCEANEFGDRSKCDDTLYETLDWKVRIYTDWHMLHVIYHNHDDGEEEEEVHTLYSQDVSFNLPTQTQLREACQNSCDLNEVSGTGCAEDGYDQQCSPTFDYDDMKDCFEYDCADPWDPDSELCQNFPGWEPDDDCAWLGDDFSSEECADSCHCCDASGSCGECHGDHACMDGECHSCFELFNGEEAEQCAMHVGEGWISPTDGAYYDNTCSDDHDHDDFWPCLEDCQDKCMSDLSCLDDCPLGEDPDFTSFFAKELCAWCLYDIQPYSYDYNKDIAIEHGWGDICEPYSDGWCYSEDSTVMARTTLIVKDTGKGKQGKQRKKFVVGPRKIKDLKVGDEIHKKHTDGHGSGYPDSVFTKVLALPSSPTSQPLYEIVMKSTGTPVKLRGKDSRRTEQEETLKATAHHSFLRCTARATGGRKKSKETLVMAKDVVAGDCLQTSSGNRLVRSTKRAKKTAPGNSMTYSVVTEGGSKDLISVGGVFAHATDMKRLAGSGDGADHGAFNFGKFGK